MPGAEKGKPAASLWALAWLQTSVTGAEVCVVSKHVFAPRVYSGRDSAAIFFTFTAKSPGEAHFPTFTVIREFW